MWTAPILAAALAAAEVPADLGAWIREHAANDVASAVRGATGEGAAAPRFVLTGRAGAGDPALAAVEAEVALALLDRVSVVAADVGWLEGEAVDRWIRGGDGELPALLPGLGAWAGAADAVQDLLRTLRARNADAKSPIRFAGLLPGPWPPLLEEAVAPLRAFSPSTAERIQSLTGIVRQTGADGRSRYYSVESSDRYIARVGVSEMISVLGSGSDELLAAAGKEQLARARHAADLLLDGLHLADFEIEGGEREPRGAVLARAAGLARAAAGEEARLLALVHLRDLERTASPDSFAARIADAAGAPPVCIALPCIAGSFLACDPAAAGPAAVVPRRIALDADGATVLERALAGRGAGTWAIATRGGPAEWLKSQRDLRSVMPALGDAREAAWPMLVARDLDLLVWRGPAR